LPFQSNSATPPLSPTSAAKFLGSRHKREQIPYSQTLQSVLFHRLNESMRVNTTRSSAQFRFSL
jgi:hypothetical protein